MPVFSHFLLLTIALLLPALSKPIQAQSAPLPLLEQNAVINQPFSLRLFLTAPTEIIFLASLDKTYFSNFTSKRDEAAITFSFLPIRSGTTSLLFSRINKGSPLRYVKYHINLFETPSQLRAAKKAAAALSYQELLPSASLKNQLAPQQRKTETTALEQSTTGAKKAESENNPVVKNQPDFEASSAYFKALMEDGLYEAAEKQLLTLAPASGNATTFFLNAAEQLAKGYAAQRRQAKAEELLKKLVARSRNKAEKIQLQLIEVRMHREEGAFEAALAKLEEIVRASSSSEGINLAGGQKGANALPVALQQQLHFERGALFYQWNKGSLAAAEYEKYFQLLQEKPASAPSPTIADQRLIGYYHLAQLYETNPALLDYEVAYNLYVQLQKRSRVNSAYHRLATERINFIKKNFFEVR